jgi:hypothetical protein
MVCPVIAAVQVIRRVGAAVRVIPLGYRNAVSRVAGLETEGTCMCESDTALERMLPNSYGVSECSTKFRILSSRESCGPRYGESMNICMSGS